MAAVDVSKVASALNLDERRVQQLVKEGMPRVSRGRYDPVKCMLWYVRYLQGVLEERSTPDIDGGSSGERVARVRLLRAGTQRDLLTAHAHFPLERRGDVIDTVAEVETERLLERLADRGFGAQAGELEGTAAAVDDPSLAVAREERGSRSRVVIVEQLEQIGKAALLAATRLTSKACIPVRSHRTVPAVRADEVMLVSHCSQPG